MWHYMNFIIKLLLICLNKIEKTHYCTIRNIINLICKREYKLSYDKINRVYKKTYHNGHFIYYSDKKRSVRIHSPYREMIKKLIYSYCLENIEFEKGDVVIDCGANVGELGLYFSQQNFDIEYIAFEPSLKEYMACKMNHPNSKIYNIGLWDEKKELSFYIKSDTADSWLFEIEDYDNMECLSIFWLICSKLLLNKISFVSLAVLSCNKPLSGPVSTEIYFIIYIEIDKNTYKYGWNFSNFWKVYYIFKVQ